MIKKLAISTLILCGSSLAIAEEITPDKKLDQTTEQSQSDDSVQPDTPEVSDAPVKQMETVKVRASTYVPEESYTVPNASTGTKTDTPIMETPMSIQVVPQEIMKEQRIHSITDAVRNVSGITQGYKNGVGDNFNIRGFNQGDATYEDGAKMSNGAAVALPRSMANIEQVEVIKGPASLLYGQGEPGGLVNNVTKKPLNYEYYEINQEIGAYNRFYTTVDATGPINQDESLLYRLNVAYENSGTYRDFVDTKRLDIYPTIQWKISPQTQITTQIHYGNGYNHLGDSGIPTFNGKHVDLPRNRNLGEPDLNQNNVEEDSIKVSWSHDFNDKWKISNFIKYEDITACRKGGCKQVFFVGNLDPATGFITFNGEPDANGNIQRAYSSLIYNGTKTWNASLNLTGKFDTWGVKHTLLTGADYYRLNEFYAGNSSLLEFDAGGNLISTHFPSINIFNPIYNQPREPIDHTNDFMVDHTAHAYGYYVQDQLELPHKVFLLAGLRFDRAVDHGNLDPNAANPYPAFPYPTFADKPPLSHRYGLLWQPVPNLSLYGSYTENFGQSAFGQIQFDGGRSPGETAQQYELGLKTESPNKRLTGSMSVYQLTKQNVLATDPVHGSPFVIPLGEVTTLGFEMDVDGQIMPGWDATVAYSYIDARTTKADPIELLGRTQGIPYNRLSLWTTYALKGDLKGIKVGGGFEANGSQLDFLKNVLPGYTTARLFASYDWRVKQSKATAQLNVENVLDKHYFGSPDNIPGAPLAATATFRIEF